MPATRTLHASTLLKVSRELSLLFLVHLYVHTKLTLIASLTDGGVIPSGIIGCCNTGSATSASDGICSYVNSDGSLSSKDNTCPVSAPISVSATADSDSGSDLINKEEVALDDFLSELEHEIYNLVKELAKNKND